MFNASSYIPVVSHENCLKVKIFPLELFCPKLEMLKRQLIFKVLRTSVRAQTACMYERRRFQGVSR